MPTQPNTLKRGRRGRASADATPRSMKSPGANVANALRRSSSNAGPDAPPMPSSVRSDPASSSQPPTSSPGSVDLSRLEKVVRKLRKDPGVAYVLASLKQGLTKAKLHGTLRENLLREVEQLLQQSPTLLKAIKEYRG